MVVDIQNFCDSDMAARRTAGLGIKYQSGNAIMFIPMEVPTTVDNSPKVRHVFEPGR